jgi:hypothetical protein
MSLYGMINPEIRLAALEAEQGHYLSFVALLALIPKPNYTKFWEIIHDHKEKIVKGLGSSHNHQNWPGGYLDHIVETMNIACQLYRTLNGLRKLPFSLHEALEVMFLHDIEKPFSEELKAEGKYAKADRRRFRADIIQKYEISLTPEQENALRYVEGIPDSEYTPDERVMGELAALCHSVDILSSRLWHDRGSKVPAPDWE